jgi:hypothetical protein
VVRVVTSAEVDAQVDQGHGDSRSQADDEYLRTQQTRGGDRLQEVAGDSPVDDRYAGDVRDDNLGFGRHDLSSNASVMSWARAVSTLPRRGHAMPLATVCQPDAPELFSS